MLISFLNLLESLQLDSFGRNECPFCYVSPQRMPIVPTINGNLNAFGIKAESAVLTNSTLVIPQLLIVCSKSSTPPYILFERNKSWNAKLPPFLNHSQCLLYYIFLIPDTAHLMKY